MSSARASLKIIYLPNHTKSFLALIGFFFHLMLGQMLDVYPSFAIPTLCDPITMSEKRTNHERLRLQVCIY